GEAHEEGESSSPLHRWEQDHTYRSTGYDIRDHHGHLHPGQTRERQEGGNVHASEDVGVIPIGRGLRVCERIPSRRRAADASRRAALLLLAIAPRLCPAYISLGRLARRAPRPPGSVRGFIHKLSGL